MKHAIKKIGQVATGIGAALTLLAGRAMAATEEITNSANPAGAGANAARGVFTRITNTVLYAVGIISVIMLIYGGLRYVVSGGDSKKVTDAKNTIIYAIIGLIVSILSYAIVNFVINAIGGGTNV